MLYGNPRRVGNGGQVDLLVIFHQKSGIGVQPRQRRLVKKDAKDFGAMAQRIGIKKHPHRPPLH